ncbi:hypothetical protein ASPZODRAFT_169523 [Penicilliopsis zonata CBS 506.65]|uniref:Azaphilone pigments biosynthesis cluster protein L N-terminal domain-containing protein n=1 Tax=Penicilliopsis zonata CBS 506.65 TaxID=1073090 RepID=A0A1L9S7S5_9EURO|nr:hypothetical protein ASPZODRAFT_169523 [Penicilliopsis zonata CBS 506.65]OJJ43209.1 hypothetical protein ASPZODRAFT_169523 [Penicilliopsis zonata CBS 506.65]
MAEALGTASAVLGLAILVYDSSHTLHDAISSFKSQRKTIKDLRSDLVSLDALLVTIKNHAERSEDPKRLEPLRQPLDCCLHACQEMHEKLKTSTRYSTNGHNSLRDWLQMQYQGKNFEQMKQRIASYKATLSISFSCINLENISRTQSDMTDLNDSITGTKEDIQDQLDDIQRKISTSDESIRAVLQQDREHLQQSLDSLAQAQRIANAAPPNIVIESNRVDTGGCAIFGTDTPQPQFVLNVSKNEAGAGATMSAGVHSPETLRGLLENSQAKVTLQALQNQSHHANSEQLQPILRYMAAQNKNNQLESAPRPAGIDQPMLGSIEAMQVEEEEQVKSYIK